MFKELLSAQVFPPFDGALDETLPILLPALDRAPPDSTMCYRPDCVAGNLRVMLLRDGTFYLSDNHGFICRVPDLDTLLCCIALDGREGGLRHAIFPNTLVSFEQERPSPLSPAQVRARALADEMQTRRGFGPTDNAPDIPDPIERSENDVGFDPSAALGELGMPKT